MMTFLSGYGTYITAAIAAVGAFLINLGLVTQDNWEKMIAILIPLALVTLRRAMANTKATVVAEVADVKAQVAVVDKKVATVATVVADSAPPFPHRPDAPRMTRP